MQSSLTSHDSSKSKKSRRTAEKYRTSRQGDVGKMQYIKIKYGHNNVLDTVICWTRCILDICLVLLFKLLNMPSEFARFRNSGPFQTPFRNEIALLWSINNLGRCSSCKEKCIKIGCQIRELKSLFWNSDFVSPFRLSLANPWTFY